MASGDIAIVQPSREWLVGSTAFDSIIALGQRFIPEECPRNNYTLEFVFSPARHETHDVMEAAVAALNDRDPSIKLLAANALGAIGPDARSAVPALKDRLQDEAAPVRQAAKAAISRIQ